MIAIMPECMNTPTFYQNIKKSTTLNFGIPCQVIMENTLINNKESIDKLTLKLIC
jgi:hypothetical protein